MPAGHTPETDLKSCSGAYPRSAELTDALTFPNGRVASGRAFVSAMTNSMSALDGTMTRNHAAFLRARLDRGAGWGGVTTCAAYVRPEGQCWDRQLGICSDPHERSLALVREVSLSEPAGLSSSPQPLLVVQLHHGGSRAPGRFAWDGWSVGPVSRDWPSAPGTGLGKGVRALSTREVESLVQAFADAAVRAERAGVDGCEIHGAHGYLLTQFLSKTLNDRRDRYGGPLLRDRSRFLLDIVRAVRSATGPHFVLGVRLSPLSYADVQGITLEETQLLTQLLDGAGVDFIHYSAWDFRRSYVDTTDGTKGAQHLIDAICSWKSVLKKCISGGIWTRADADWCLRSGMDFVQIGRAALRHPNWPVAAAAHFVPERPPHRPQDLKAAGLDEHFIAYMRRWDGFVS
jgi:2,4-dienoyl-CoA reductase-like NADH-dependent reductase (Old Yellow Enzyme family)